MKIGLIDIDGHNFPNIPLMKLSAWHKAQGDSVEWYQPLISGHMDKVYCAKVFSFTPDYAYHIDADQVVKGGTGYHIHLQNGREIWQGADVNLPEEIEHTYPDYDLYGIKDTAYGFLSRGCPRGCFFCHVKSKEGMRSRKVANLCEFWGGAETDRGLRSEHTCLPGCRGSAGTACRKQSDGQYQPGTGCPSSD